jgi:hypothetical protein
MARQDADPPQHLAPELTAAMAGLQAALQRHVDGAVAAAEAKAAEREREALRLASRVEYEARRRAERILVEALAAAWVILEQSRPDTGGDDVTTVGLVAAELGALPQAEVRQIARAAVQRMQAAGQARRDGERFLVRFGLHEQHAGVIDEVYGARRARPHRVRTRTPWRRREATP